MRTLLLLLPLISCLAMSSGVRFVLGSGSASRRLILSNMQWPFEVVKPDLDERAIGDRSSAEGARELVLLLGEAKADNILALLTNEQRTRCQVLITCDQVVTHKGKILEKPVDAAEARAFIRSYGEAPCATVGSVVLTNILTGKRVSGTDTATIYLKSIPDRVIDELIEEGDVLYCAGGLMIEHAKVGPYIDRLDGTMDSIMGLSQALLERLLPEVLRV